jgi:hypothetical protein
LCNRLKENNKDYLHANFQLVDFGELFPTAASNSGFTLVVGYPSSKVEVLICNEISPKCFFISKRQSYTF